MSGQVRVLIADKMDPKAAAIFRERGIDVDEKPGLSPEEFRAIIGEYDGLAVRSSTKVNAAAMDAAVPRLKVIGRGGIGVGTSTSVIPYVADQIAMARLTRAAYALMVSLLPATATVVGLIVLTQVPSATDVAGIALVIVGVALHREPTPPPAAPPSPTPRPSPAATPIPAASGTHAHP